LAKPKVVFHPTPNPNAGKFTVGRTLVEGRSGRTYGSADEAAGDPVARVLLAEDGVEGVFVVADFVTVTKSAAARWNDLAPRIIQRLAEALPAIGARAVGDRQRESGEGTR
jgi:hypothetical protein